MPDDEVGLFWFDGKTLHKANIATFHAWTPRLSDFDEGMIDDVQKDNDLGPEWELWFWDPTGETMEDAEDMGDGFYGAPTTFYQVAVHFRRTK